MTNPVTRINQKNENEGLKLNIIISTGINNVYSLLLNVLHKERAMQ